MDIIRLSKGGSTVLFAIEIGNTCKDYSEGDKWVKWKVFVNDFNLIISSVTFKLHPTHQPDLIKIDKFPFEVEGKSWGTFNIIITLSFNTGDKNKEITHELVFNSQGKRRIEWIRLSSEKALYIANNKYEKSEHKDTSNPLDILKENLSKYNLDSNDFNYMIYEKNLIVKGKVSINDASIINMISFKICHKYGMNLDVKNLHYYNPNPNPNNLQHYSNSPDDYELIEYHDSVELIKEKAIHVANLIKMSKHFVVYTGAGISTAAKIPDFRGPSGVWTRRDRGMPPPSSVSMEEAQPTLAHNIIFTLINRGYIKYLVSQNVDGLHRRSGVPQDKISELHGNCYIEICSKCRKEYLRSYDVGRRKGPLFKGVADDLSKSGISHITGRSCDDCGGILRDSIIHFSENLPEKALILAEHHSNKADLGLVLGSSLRVTPASELPELCKGPLNIINLQITGKDRLALQKGGILIRSKCDELMKYIMDELDINIDNLKL